MKPKTETSIYGILNPDNHANKARYYKKIFLLTSTEYALLDFIKFEMTKANLIRNDRKTKMAFQKLQLDSGCQRKAKTSTLNNAFVNLRKLGFLLKETSIEYPRGLYRVNPIFFWKGFRAERLKLIEVLRNNGTLEK